MTEATAPQGVNAVTPRYEEQGVARAVPRSRYLVREPLGADPLAAGRWMTCALCVHLFDPPLWFLWLLWLCTPGPLVPVNAVHSTKCRHQR